MSEFDDLIDANWDENEILDLKRQARGNELQKKISEAYGSYQHPFQNWNYLWHQAQIQKRKQEDEDA